MPDLLILLVLLAVFLIGLALLPFGLPGLWLMVLGVVAYGWWTGFERVGAVTIGIAVALALVGEALEWWLGFRFAARYGGSRQAGWAALAGGLVGAVVGVPIPIVGSIVGALLGAFLGAGLVEYRRTRTLESAASSGWGAVLGRVAGTAVKIALGLVIVVVVGFAIARGG